MVPWVKWGMREVMEVDSEEEEEAEEEEEEEE